MPIIEKILITSFLNFIIINVFHISHLRKEAHDACTSKLLCKSPPICANWFDWDHIVFIVPIPACIVDVGKVLSMKLIINKGQNGGDAARKVVQNFSGFFIQDIVFIDLIIVTIISFIKFAPITECAGCVETVSARFALDKTPSKDLAINSDITSGYITNEDAKVQRTLEHKKHFMACFTVF